jgi:hypothetical protein
MSRDRAVQQSQNLTTAETTLYYPASIAVSLAFLRCGGASPPAATRSTKTHVAHRRIKIERVYRPYLTAAEAVNCRPRDFPREQIRGLSGGSQVIRPPLDGGLAICQPPKATGEISGQPEYLASKHPFTMPLTQILTLVQRAAKTSLSLLNLAKCTRTHLLA